MGQAARAADHQSSSNWAGREISSEIKRMGREPDILEGDVLEVEYATADGSYATSRPDRARPPRRLQHYFPTEE
jgi:hypothetical protein